MSNTQKKQIQDVESLLEERRKYEQWLSQLESRKASTAPHVFSRVHQDYLSRLGETQSKLAAESGMVQTLVADLSTSLQSHEQQISAKQDERAEAELRSAVGEYSEGDWDKLRGSLDTTITTLTGARDAIAKEHDTLRALLNEATAPSPATPMVSVAPPASAAPSIAEAPSGGAPRRPAADGPRTDMSTPAPAQRKNEVDELAFLRSVLGRSTPYTNTGQQAAVNSAPAGAAAPKDASPKRETPAGRGASAATAPKPEPQEEFRTGLGLPTPRASEAVKTLKCQECGTMNFPTEWYCERCGGELSAF